MRVVLCGREREGERAALILSINQPLSHHGTKKKKIQNSKLQRSVLIPEGSPAGYGARGLGEIPPNGGFELQIEVLDVVPVWSGSESGK